MKDIDLVEQFVMDANFKRPYEITRWDLSVFVKNRFCNVYLMFWCNGGRVFSRIVGYVEVKSVGFLGRSWRVLNFSGDRDHGSLFDPDLCDSLKRAIEKFGYARGEKWVKQAQKVWGFEGFLTLEALKKLSGKQ